MPVVDINELQIVNALESAFEESMDVLERRFVKEFTEEKWQWPSGESPRDIVNFGLLRGSQLKTRIFATVYEWSWNMEYALAVHNGATFTSGPLKGKTFPARPWTKKPLEDLPTIFNKLAGKHLGGVK